MIEIRNNFLTNKEVDFLIEILAPKLQSISHVVAHTETALGFKDSVQAAQWTYSNPIVPFTDNPEHNKAVNFLTTIYKKMKTELETFYLKELGLVQFILNRMHTGAENSIHVDNATGMYPELEYSAMIYLNDCGVDFKGGELNFPKQGKEIKTTKGMLVFFKGDDDVPHGVNKVTSGHRDNFISFFKSLP
jgi:predicted 2-oxoglutarate/Fe(II)-dependent dioxygenase YbiX